MGTDGSTKADCLLDVRFGGGLRCGRVPAGEGASSPQSVLPHLALEKMIKALVVRQTGQTPPKIHNLVRLALRAGLKPDPEQERFLRRFDVHQLEGRYPDSQLAEISAAWAQEELREAAEILQWLKAQS